MRSDNLTNALDFGADLPVMMRDMVKNFIFFLCVHWLSPHEFLTWLFGNIIYFFRSKLSFIAKKGRDV